MLDQLGKRNWWSVGARRDQSAENRLGESGVSSANQELEKLHNQVMVQVLALAVFLRSVLNSTSSN